MRPVVTGSDFSFCQVEVFGYGEKITLANFSAVSFYRVIDSPHSLVRESRQTGNQKSLDVVTDSELLNADVPSFVVIAVEPDVKFVQLIGAC